MTNGFWLIEPKQKIIDGINTRKVLHATVIANVQPMPDSDKQIPGVVDPTT